jgi:hypothetical protein
MAKSLLDRSQVAVNVQKMSCECVPQQVRMQMHPRVIADLMELPTDVGQAPGFTDVDVGLDT